MRLPFQKLTPAARLNLALAAILSMYFVIIGFYIVNNDICGNIGFDYCAYWSGGKIINDSGYADIYDVNILKQYQKAIYPQAELLSDKFIPIELPYLPVFLIPFRLLSLLNIQTGYLFWTLINQICYFFYLKFFIEKVVGKINSNRIVLMALLSLPVFLNIYFGQLNIWLGICAGEFIRAYLSHKPQRAGIWLAGWLLKPQLLLIVIPFLVVQRSYKVLKGFFIATIFILLFSFRLINIDGLLGLVSILSESAQGGATSNPQIMMNWRMLGVNISALSSTWVGWTVIILGTIATIVAAFLYLKNLDPTRPDRSMIIILGLFTVACVTAWHAHFHMSIVLIPPLIYMYAKNYITIKQFNFWLFMPIFIHFTNYLLLLIIRSEFLPSKFYQLVDFSNGFRGFVLNLLILFWTIKLIKKFDFESIPSENEFIYTKSIIS